MQIIWNIKKAGLLGLGVSKYVLFFMLLLGSTVQTLGQTNVRENAYLHLSNNEFIVGETLYFTGYVYSETTSKLSKLSNILYVDVLDENYKSIYRTQIEVEEGAGTGQYYLPTELETGNYHVVAYTRWMQNFNDLYHQPITIINPYKQYVNPTEEQNDITISFSPEGGYLMDGVGNKVIVRAMDKYGRGQVISGRVIDNNGNTLAKVRTDSFGTYPFSITPKWGETYQLITETSSGFSFYDLPSACAQCTRLGISKKADTYLIDLRSNISTDKNYELLIVHNSDTVKNVSVQPNSETFINKNELSKGLYVAVLSIDGKKYSERIFWNGALGKHLERKVETYSTNKEVSVSLDIEKPSTLSVSVTKVTAEMKPTESIGFEDAINKGLDVPINDLGKNSLTAQSLDNLLICSRQKVTKPLPKTVELFPEHNYGVVQGKILNSDGEPVANEEIGLSFMGTNENVTVTTSDSSGRFSLFFDYKILHKLGTIKAINRKLNDYELQVNEPFYVQYPQFINPPVMLDSGAIQEIVKRSIHNQIQNAYYLPDTTQKVKKQEALSGMRSFILDDYTRFQTMRDTFIELIPEVGISKNEKKYELRMRMEGIELNTKQSASALLLLDGVFVSAKTVLEISPFAVEKIDVLNRRYYFGNVFFNGVISVHTFKRDMGQVAIEDFALDPTEVQAFGSPKEVSKNLDNRTPNYEHLLLWKPYVKHSGGELNLNFFTSEVEGLFSLVIEGITIDGDPVSMRKYFRVKK